MTYFVYHDFSSKGDINVYSLCEVTASTPTEAALLATTGLGVALVVQGRNLWSVNIRGTISRTAEILPMDKKDFDFYNERGIWIKEAKC
jgi:hypothetical protein